jgi:hypothetical protein
MSLGFGPNIYLRGALPIYSNMVASATDLLSGGVFPFGLHLHIFCLYGNVLMFGLIQVYLPICKHEYLVPPSAKNLS